MSQKLMDRVRSALRLHQYSYQTEKSYCRWIVRYIHFHGIRHPAEMGATEVEAFLSYLASQRKVSASTQNQALSALLFLYRNVLDLKLPWLDNIVRARRPQRIPVVLDRSEVARILGGLSGKYWLIASLLYGSGLRLIECLRLRLKDIDTDYLQISVFDGKGKKDRRTVLPQKLVPHVRRQTEVVLAGLDNDRSKGRPGVSIPYALDRKYANAPLSPSWQYLFPSVKYAYIEFHGEHRRHHLHPNSVQRVVRGAAIRSGIRKRVSCHTFRHSFATHLIESGYDIRTVQELLGHSHVNTTMIYTHVLQRGGKCVRSPFDAMP